MPGVVVLERPSSVNLMGWGGYGTPVAVPEYTAPKMPSPKGTVLVTLGAVLLLLFLALTQWRIKGPQEEGTPQFHMRKMQLIVAHMLNDSSEMLNEQLGRRGKEALGARLLLFVTACTVLAVGVLQVFLSTWRRRSFKGRNPYFHNNPSFTKRGLLTLFLAFLAILAAAQGSRHLDKDKFKTT